MSPHKTKIAPGGIVHTIYELDEHSNVLGPLAEELFEAEVPVERLLVEEPGLEEQQKAPQPKLSD